MNIVGIIGAGAIGTALALRLTAAGNTVLLSNSRGPESLTEVAERLGSNLVPSTIREAASAEIVILAVPWDRLKEAVATAGVLDWGGRIVIDATNPAIGPDLALADLGGRTSSEVVAELLPGGRLVKAFNTLLAAVLAAEPRSDGKRRVIFLSGDHPVANRDVASLAEAAGWATIDLGPLATGARLQQFPGGPLPTLNLLLES